MPDSPVITQPLNDLRVTIVQPDSLWQQPEANRRLLAERIRQHQQCQPADLVVLPEMFTAGFSMNVKEVAEAANGPTLAWMQELAADTGAVICGSYAVDIDPQGALPPVNRMQWVTPDGGHHFYDKRHLFRMGGEHKRYQAGSDKLLVEWKGWRICPLVCYDLRFPVWCRNRDDFDLQIFVANWPAARAYHWRQLLIARAIENQACVIGVNRVGVDGNGLAYSGDSLVVDAQGALQIDAGAEEGLFTTLLSAEALRHYRQRFPAWLDADDFQLL